MTVRVGFPTMGWCKIAAKGLLSQIPNIEIVDPPFVTKDIVEMGIKNSPEMACFPFKVTIGEMINLIKNHGVNTIVFAMDLGPCRFGFYLPIQERILKDMGYNVRIYALQQDDLRTLEWLNIFPKLKADVGIKTSFMRIVKGARLYYLKAKIIEKICKIEGLIRCREINKGDTTKTVARLMKWLDKENSLVNLRHFEKIIRQEFRKMPINRDLKPLRIMTSGEIHVYLEPYVNFDLTRRYGDEGVEVHLALHLYDWLMHKMHINFRRKRLAIIGSKYIPLDIGGEAQWDIGAYIDCQHRGFDGFCVLYPFTCMPETALRGIIEGQSPDPFYLPVQYYSFDETTGYEGLRTRMEAFIDLMKMNRKNNQKFKDKYVEPPEIAEIYDEVKKPPLVKRIYHRITQFMFERLYLRHFRKAYRKYNLSLKQKEHTKRQQKIKNTFEKQVQPEIKSL